MKQIKAEKIAKNVTRVVVPFKRSNEWEYRVLIAPDIHMESIKCNLPLFKKHSKQVAESGSGMILPGDLYDVMGGKYDPRSTKYELHPRFANSTAYIDDCVEWVSQTLKDLNIATNIHVIGEGNHETAIKSRLEVSLIDRTVALLKQGTTATVTNGSYAGWVQYVFEDPDNAKVRHQININYHHGSGYKSAAARMRRIAEHPDAHILVLGHWHDFFSEYKARYRLNQRGSEKRDSVLILQCPGYKDDYGDGAGGWCIEKGHSPKKLGAWWIKFTFDRATKRIIYSPEVAQ